jgi:hypothetical protein
MITLIFFNFNYFVQMTDFTTNIQEYLEAADKAYIAASVLPPTITTSTSTPIPPSPLSSPHSAAPASVLPSHSPFVYPAAAVAAGLSPSWSSVGGYDHPQPGSRLMQYGTFLAIAMCIAMFVIICLIIFVPRMLGRSEYKTFFRSLFHNSYLLLVLCVEEMTPHRVILFNYHINFNVNTFLPDPPPILPMSIPVPATLFPSPGMGWMPDKSLNPSTIYSNHLMNMSENTVGTVYTIRLSLFTL